MIRVLIVEDSPTVTEFLKHVFNSNPGFTVVGAATNGEEALPAVRKYKPDVITMDIHMPRMDGFEATRQIMETQPTPIVIVSGNAMVKEVAFSFRAIEAGALAVVKRPQGIGGLESEKDIRELVTTVKLMSEIKVIRRWNSRNREPALPQVPEVKIGSEAEIRIIAMGASTGGPLALQTILSGLPRNFPVPVLVVQHIVAGFIPGFVEWLKGSSVLPLHIPGDNEYASPGHVYVAPDSFQMLITAGNRIRLNKEEARNGLCPSVGHLFRSAAENYGRNAAAVLLTGMGTDGAREMKLLRDLKAVTIAQNEESSVVHGMPGEAIKLGGAGYVLPLSEIAPMLISLTRRSP